MENTIITKALKLFRMSIKDVLRIETKDLTAKVYLKGGRGCLYLEGWTSEMRRKRQKDGRYTFFRLQLEEPRYRVKLNSGGFLPVQ